MKKLFFLPAVIGLVISSCQEPASETEPPVLEITTSKNIEVPLEGGDFSFSYKLENQTPEGVISAGTKADWITGVNYGTEGSVTFNVSPNSSSEQRTGYVAITYTYDGGTLSDSVAAVQSASEPVEYDYELDAAIFTGYYYGNAFGNDGEHNYWITFSDTEMIDLEMQPGGIYYSFDIFAPAPENADNPSLPMGTYTMGQPGETKEMTFTPDYSIIKKLNAAGDNYDYSFTMADGTLTFSQEGSDYVCEGIITDNEGNTHHVKYTGQLSYINDPQTVPEYKTIDEDITLTAKNAFVMVNFNTDDGNIIVDFRLTDMEGDYFDMVPPGTMFQAEAIMPDNLTIYPTTGTYTIEEGEHLNSMTPGWMRDYQYPQGCYVKRFESADDEPGFAFGTKGTMTISGEPGNYDVVYTFQTENRHTMTCTYSGPIIIDGISGIMSTLTEDYTLDLSEAEGVDAKFMGDVFENGGGRWFITIDHFAPNGDGIQIELVTNSTDFEDGIPTGTYTVGSYNNAEPGQFLTGYVDYDNYIYGTCFLGYDDYTELTRYAMAINGEIEITNKGNNEYDISFSLLDKHEYTFDGSWSGTLPVQDISEAPAPQNARRIDYMTK